MADTTLRMILLGEDRSASKSLKGVGDEATKAEGKLGKFHKVGHAAGVALAGGLALAGAAAISMTKRAAEDQQAAAKLAQTLQKATGATKGQVAQTEAWITAQGKAFGVTDDDLRPAISRLAVATGSVTEAQKLAKLAMDISAGSGKSLSAVSTALAKAQNGNVSGLGRLGVATKDAAGKTLSLHAITKNLAATYTGAAAASAQTAAGKQKILTVQMGELQEQIGAKLLPVMLKLANIGLKIVGWISNNTKVAGILIGVLGALVATVWAVSAATKAWAAITKVYTAGQWLLNAALSANPIGLIVVAIAALVVGLVIAYKHSEKFRHIVTVALHAVAAAAKAVGNFFSNTLPGFFTRAWAKITAGAQKVGRFFTTTVPDFFRKSWQVIKTLVTDYAKLMLAVYIGIPMRVLHALGSLVSKVKQPFSNAMHGALDVVKNVGSTVLDWIGGIPDRIAAKAAWWAASGKRLIHAFVDGMKNAGGVISGIAGNVWDAVKSLINGAISKINAALNFTIHIPGPDIHVNAGQIPHLAKGGVVRARPGGTIALLGEAGRDEAVVPLPRAGFGASGGDTITVNVSESKDAATTAREVVAAIRKLKRELGGAPLGIA